MGAVYSNKVVEKEIGKLDSVALYFDLVYNQNGSASQVGLLLDKKVVRYVENREKTWRLWAAIKR